MTESTLICWNCSKRSPPGKCTNCNAELRSPNSNSSDKQVEKKYIIRIQHNGGQTAEFSLDKLEQILEKNFKIIDHLYHRSPAFIVQHTGKNLDHSYKDLVQESNELSDGLTPNLINPKNYLQFNQNFSGEIGEAIVIRFFILPKITVKTRPLFIPLLVATILSVIIAGALTCYNYLAAFNSQTPELSVTRFINSLNLEFYLLTLAFSSVIIGLLLVRWVLQIITDKRIGSNSKMFFLPTFFPLGEIGTVGFLSVEQSPHKSKSNLFNSIFAPSVIAWILAITIFIASFPLSTASTTSSDIYANFSVLASGSFEPVFLRITGYVLQFSGMMNLESASITKTYLFHPITLAAFSMVYVFGIHLLPLRQLSGGALVEVSVKRPYPWLLSIMVILALILMQIWWLAIVALFIFVQHKGTFVQNEFSKLPKFYKLKLILVILIGILSFPVPVELLNLS